MKSKVIKSMIEWIQAFAIAIGLSFLLFGISYADLDTAAMKAQIQDNVGSGSWIQYGLGGASLIISVFIAHKSLLGGIGVLVTTWGLISLFNANLIGGGAS